MKKQIKLDSLRKAYFSKLIASKMSLDDIMPLFAKANGIFELRQTRRKKMINDK